jgi:hypothetical protein
MVSLEGGATAVVGIAIGLDYQSSLGPEEVNEMSFDEDIHLGQRQAILSA